MRIMIKGGVWKNTEDEILKAAVMKYGKNQWARVSSLLVRKSAKQCKARWYEWLDPSIKKTEWTREEDEKLLHLAKLMPTQWRTIAPIVGRTPAQCLERYEKLLDAACTKDDTYDPADDPRRLRPGEIDPNPESKPARPDPVDMDEDEKEMLSEARARLANTRGKKAKRKAREKALEEARRLAQLQKTRELKAAGIELRAKQKKKKGIDYNAEVAFEKRAPQGFYDTYDEQEMSKTLGKEFRPVTIEEMEGKRRKDIEENLQKQDVKRQKMQARNDAPSAVAKNLAMNEVNPLHGSRRGKMMLPAPQVSEAELQTMAKNGGRSDVDPEVLDGAGGEATKTLLGQYGQTPAATPMRTPRTPAMGFDPIMQQAENLARMSSMSTPLAGGENPELHPSDFSGVTPRAQVAATPNPIATPHRNQGATPAVGATPGGYTSRATSGVALTPASMLGTPSRHNASLPQHRDELGLNDQDSTAVWDGKHDSSRVAATMAKNELLAGLSQLPAPQNEYQIMVPDIPMDESAPDAMEEDAADAAKRRAREAQIAHEEELKRRSQVLQRQLPRPSEFQDIQASADTDNASTNPSLAEAAKLVMAEMFDLLRYENVKYPSEQKKKDEGSKKKKKRDKRPTAVHPGGIPDLDQFEQSELRKAGDLIREEALFLKHAMGHASNTDKLADAMNTAATLYTLPPGSGTCVARTSLSEGDKLQILQEEFDAARGDMGKEAAKAAKLEKKIAILSGGLQAREKKLLDRLEAVQKEYLSVHEESTCYEALREHEMLSAPSRTEELKQLLAAALQREVDLQSRFKELTSAKSQLNP